MSGGWTPEKLNGEGCSPQARPQYLVVPPESNPKMLWFTFGTGQAFPQRQDFIDAVLLGLSSDVDRRWSTCIPNNPQTVRWLFHSC